MCACKTHELLIEADLATMFCSCWQHKWVTERLACKHPKRHTPTRCCREMIRFLPKPASLPLVKSSSLQRNALKPTPQPLSDRPCLAPVVVPASLWRGPDARLLSQCRARHRSARLTRRSVCWCKVEAHTSIDIASLSRGHRWYGPRLMLIDTVLTFEFF